MIVLKRHFHVPNAHPTHMATTARHETHHIEIICTSLFLQNNISSQTGWRTEEHDRLSIAWCGHNPNLNLPNCVTDQMGLMKKVSVGVRQL